MMTRRNFIDLAYILHYHRKKFKSARALSDFIVSCCMWAQAENMRFNSVKFTEAVYSEDFWKHKVDNAKQQTLFNVE